MYDAIVVGARCAGAAVALLLARRGQRVLLVDRATFPSDTISGHLMLHPGVRKLAEWGLLEGLLATNCPPVNMWSSDVGDFVLRGEIPTSADLPASIGPRRTVLDAFLINAAVAAGAELHEGFYVNGVIADGGQITGIRGHIKDGQVVSERATLVIGADGKHSKIAQLVQAPTYGEVASRTCWYMSYWSDFPSTGVEINWRPQRAVFTFPTNDGLTMAAVAWPHHAFHQFRADIEGNYRTTIQMMPSLAERLPGAQRVERIVGMSDLPTFFRKPYGPGWALVGDAGHHKDPTLALGISDAFCDAELLATAIDKGMSGRQPLLNALACYEQQRNARAIPQNDATLEAAQLEGWDNPDALRLRTALRDNPIDAGRFFAVQSNVLPPQSFFAPDNMKRIMTQAGMPKAAAA